MRHRALHVGLFLLGTGLVACGYVEAPAVVPYAKALMTFGAGVLAVARWDRVGKAPKELE